MPITLTEEAAANLWAVLLTLVLGGCSTPSEQSTELIRKCIEFGGSPRIDTMNSEFLGCDFFCPPARFRPDYFEQPAPPAKELP